MQIFIYCWTLGIEKRKHTFCLLSMYLSFLLSPLHVSFLPLFFSMSPLCSSRCILSCPCPLIWMSFPLFSFLCFLSTSPLLSLPIHFAFSLILSCYLFGHVLWKACVICSDGLVCIDLKNWLCMFSCLFKHSGSQGVSGCQQHPELCPLKTQYMLKQIFWMKCMAVNMMERERERQRSSLETLWWKDGRLLAVNCFWRCCCSQSYSGPEGQSTTTIQKKMTPFHEIWHFSKQNNF